jgi:hypothetical protein
VAEQNKFGNMPDATPGSGGLRCEEWEALLADALDGRLPAGETAAFHAHSADCAGCADLLAHAKQGQEWLEYLHAEPEVPAGLVSKILDKTAGAGAIPVQVIAGAGPVAGASAAAIPWRRSFQETRLLMTVAMAFFSIALTLNMAGVKLTNLRMADLRPGTIGSTLSRQFWGAQSSVVRFYDNMRFVYQLESKMRELRRDSQTPQQQEAPKKQSPSSRNDGAGPQAGLRAQNAGSRSQVTGYRSQSAASGAQGPGDRVQAAAQVTGRNKARVIRATETEINGLNTPDSDEAGPRRNVVSAGCKGRSLA